jgi:hypothetical protein
MTFPHELNEEDRKKGGSTRSTTKHFHSVLNGLLSRKDLSDTQRTHLALLRSGEYLEIFRNHFAADLLYIEDLENEGRRGQAFRARQVVAAKILKLMEVTSQHVRDDKELEILAEMVQCLKNDSPKP